MSDFKSVKLNTENLKFSGRKSDYRAWYHSHFKPDVILIVTSATTQGKQIKAVPLTMVHAPSYLPASSCRITKHLATLHIISHSPECPLSSDHLPTTDLSLSLMMIQASIRPSLHASLPSN